ncbi:hypothetical protein RLOC_00004745, partial [Lonchura striata]
GRFRSPVPVTGAHRPLPRLHPALVFQRLLRELREFRVRRLRRQPEQLRQRAGVPGQLRGLRSLQQRQPLPRRAVLGAAGAGAVPRRLPALVLRPGGEIVPGVHLRRLPRQRQQPPRPARVPAPLPAPR